MIGSVSRVRHGIVGAAIGGTALLAATGVIGTPDRPERFETWHVVIQPAGGDGLRFTETFDQDFGDQQRSGHEGYIPNDLGAPTDVVADSPDAPDVLAVDALGGETRVRIGDPDRKITGQHRYALAYTLPAARLDSGVLSVDVLDPGPYVTDHVEVVLTGMVLDDVQCFVGASGSANRCDVIAEDGVYRIVIAPLPAGLGVTVEADILGRAEPVAVAPPPIPERRSPPNRGLLALAVAGLGGLGAVPVHRWARRRGRNEVFAGGAADAAYGTLPAPGSDGSVAPPPPIKLVADDEMSDLATIEFVPPKGLAPWAASVLLTERLGDDAVEAWISGLVAREAIIIHERGDDVSLASGPARGQLDAPDAELLNGILGIDDPYVTGIYDPRFAAAWNAVKRAQRRRIAESGWWVRQPPGAGVRFSSTGWKVGLLAFVLLWSGSTLSALLGAFGSVWSALMIGAVFPAVVAYFVYRVLLPARSAQGSALALRAESFRRFLHASEGRHVEWAWSKGLLREYSAWSVALGEADAWSKALDGANVPAPARAAAGPLIVHSRGSSMRSARTAPSSSGGGGGGGGGGSRGGRVGGGGGGRSRGSF